MELLDRYLQAVGRLLPTSRQEDIIAELRANLESQLEEKQAELGRPLTPAESEAWVQGLGSPMRMAAHYQPQQYLIGPAIFPVYIYVLRLASMWSIAVYILVSTITIVVSSSANGRAVAEAAQRLPFVLIQVAAWVTAIFAAFEFFAARYPDKCPPIGTVFDKWSALDLPPLETPAVAGKKRRTYAHAVAEIIFGFIFLGWLLVIPKHPFMMFGPGAAILHSSPFRLAPIWWTFYWWIVGLNALELAWKCLDLVRDSWREPDRFRNVVVRSFALIPLGVLAMVPNRMYVLLRNPDHDAFRFGQPLDSINHGIYLGLVVVGIIACLQLAGGVVAIIMDGRRWRSMAH